MADRELLQAVRAVIIDNHFLPCPLLQELLPFFGGGQICQGGLALLQSFPVEPVTAIDIDGSPDVVHIVCNEGPAVQEQEVVGWCLQLGGEPGRHDGGGLLQKKGPLKGGTFTARRGG